MGRNKAAYEFPARQISVPHSYTLGAEGTKAAGTVGGAGRGWGGLAESKG